jgi:hypothetical protein
MDQEKPVYPNSETVAASLDRVTGEYFLKSREEEIREQKEAFHRRLKEKLGEDYETLCRVMQDLERRAVEAEGRHAALPADQKATFERIAEQKKLIEAHEQEIKDLKNKLQAR